MTKEKELWGHNVRAMALHLDHRCRHPGYETIRQLCMVRRSPRGTLQRAQGLSTNTYNCMWNYIISKWKMTVRASEGSEKRLMTIKVLVKYGCKKQSQGEAGVNCTRPEATTLQGHRNYGLRCRTSTRSNRRWKKDQFVLPQNQQTGGW